MSEQFRTRRYIAMAVVALFLLVLSYRLISATKDSNARARANACRALTPDPVPARFSQGSAPDFELTNVEGKKVSLRDYRGKAVLLNFWATWCPPCTEEMPGMEQLAHKLKSRDAVVLAVSVDEGWEPVKKFLPKDTELSVVLDVEKKSAKLYGTEKYPETFLIDPEGRVRHYFINKRDWSSPEAVFCIESVL